MPLLLFLTGFVVGDGVTAARERLRVLYPVLMDFLMLFLLDTQLVNKTPRWNESLGAFCLNFQVFVVLWPREGLAVGGGRERAGERAGERERERKGASV